MLKTEDNSDFGLNDDSDNSSMDVDKFFAILSEESDPANNYFLNNSEYLLSDHFQAEVPHVEVNHERSSQPQNAEPCRPSMWHHSDYQEPSEFRPRMGSGCLSDFRGNSDTVEHEKLETLPLTESPLHSSVSLAEWSASYAEHDTGSSRERVGSSINAHLHSNADSKMLLDYITNYNMALNFVAGHANHASSCADHMDSMQLKSENGYEFKHDGGDSQPKFASHLVTNLTMNSANQTALSESCVKDLETHERYPCTSLDEAPSRSVEMVFPDVTQSELNNDSEVSGVHFESSNYCSEARPHSGSVVDNGPFSDLSKQFLPRTYDFPAIVSKRENMFYVKDEVGEALTGASLQESTLMDCASIGSCQDTSFKWEDGSPCSAIRRNSFDADDKTSVIDFSQSLVGIPSLVSSKGEIVCIEDGRHDKLLASKSFSSHSSNFIDVTVADIGSPISEISAFGADHASSDLMHIELLSKKKPTVGIKDEKEDKLILHRSMTSQAAKLTGEVWGSGSIRRSHIDVDADADVCILEDISDPRRPPSVAVNGKSLPVVVHGRSVVTSQSSAISDPHHHTGMGGTRLKINDERLTFRAALQGLSQPKAEAAPPDGVLAVSLLRHQRIALSWMMQKETASLHCSGGILADDQGLGKTISTIALILKERPPSSKMTSTSLKRDESEALNLDEDDDSEACQLDGSKQDGDSGYVMVNGGSLKNKNAVMPRKGRPAAGTLIVCPTSVLRQWADELHNKVTREANLSVLVYHGSNRTKDPLELAKYDVVLTTYSIVSMEVPKQPLVDKDDDDQGKQEGHSALSVEFSSSRKRKYAPSSDKKSGKNKKGMDGALLEAVALPLARVGWFRVVLDEAQSIKNHRTQVARACWGLRAKRRWCLSGTPIQNAVDDLYSYFRFLRYDPYAAYKSFCSMIKVPITRNPTNGYKKLQLVLKTIMLRRTKGTFIDGQPIISLPPKSVELKKVDFSKEERDFYSKLEADSRAQFKVYAAAGTVKQNYVNILLMLLRLRQACDHPLLVKGYDSNSVWRSSIQMAKKLPREQQIDLLNCLEASLAICGICNDPPKDAVVTICRHVFCNQCICEHLTIDDHLCPAAQCKDQLNVTSVFSRATLKSSLFEQPDHSDSADKSTSQFVETLEPFSEGLADSSKIKAAVEILQAISKPRHCTSDIGSLKSSDEIPTYLGNDCDSLAVGSFNDIPKVKHDETEKLCDDSSNKTPEKAIVFSQWTRMLDLLESRLKESSILYRRLDGTMSVMARDKAVKDFNTLPEVSVMIMSLKAASLGLNMVAACHVLLLDLWWNPTTEDQAIDRAHRIGQTRPVTVLRLTVKDTVEDRILALQQKKREMVASAFGEDETGGRQTRLTVDDLSYLFMV